jgi:macrolide transport system ATP-binding/permease protein
VRLHLLGQESPRATHRRARDLYEAHTARLVTAGVLKEDEVVGLGSLGLLTSRDAGKPVAELSSDELTEAPHNTDAAVVVATLDRQLRRDISVCAVAGRTPRTPARRRART